MRRVDPRDAGTLARLRMGELVPVLPNLRRCRLSGSAALTGARPAGSAFAGRTGGPRLEVLPKQSEARSSERREVSESADDRDHSGDDHCGEDRAEHDNIAERDAVAIGDAIDPALLFWVRAGHAATDASN